MNTLEEIRPAWAEIDLDNLSYNLSQIKKLVSDSTEIMAVVKGNAYGHGAVEISKVFLEEGVNKLAVATLSEAIELRNAGIDAEILILGYTPKSQLRSIIKYNITQTIYNYETAYELSEIGKEMNKTCNIHIKIDTGMSRLGFRTEDEDIKNIIKISKLSNVFIEGIFSHFSTADESDKLFVEQQYREFILMINKLEKNNLYIPIKHISNSASIIDLPEYNLDLVRPGIILYGLYPSKEVKKENLKLKPVMTLKAKISNVKIIPKETGVSYGRTFITDKETTIATIPIGYADGFTRMLIDKGNMLVNGKKAKVVGKVCMDQCMLDVTGIEDVYIGQEVIIFGNDEKANSVDEIADELKTINYEILCMVSRRIPRVYKKNNKIVKIIDYLIHS